MIKCTVCSAMSNLSLSFNDIYLYRCPVCDHCFTDVDKIVTNEKYDPEYFNEKHKNWFMNPNIYLYNKIIECFNGLPGDASVLDVGCGRGHFLRYLRSKNSDFIETGLDLAWNENEVGINYIQGDINSYCPDSLFDIVISLAVIEHIHNVRSFMRRLGALCKPDGIIVIMTLNDRSVLYALARLLAKFNYMIPVMRLYEQHHLNHFSRTSLVTLANNVGFTVEKIINTNSPLSSIDIDSRSTISHFLLKSGIVLTFLMGFFMRKTFL